MIAIFLGLLSVALGCYGILVLTGDFFIIIKRIVPFSFICGGLLSILAGISSLRK